MYKFSSDDKSPCDEGEKFQNCSRAYNKALYEPREGLELILNRFGILNRHYLELLDSIQSIKKIENALCVSPGACHSVKRDRHAAKLKTPACLIVLFYSVCSMQTKVSVVQIHYL